MNSVVKVVTGQVKSPISNNGMGGKVEVFEQRMNGKVLPFLGLHGMLLALISLIQSDLFGEFIKSNSLELFGVSALLLVIGASYSFFKRKSFPSGVMTALFCISMIGILVQSSGNMSVIGAGAVFVILLMLNSYKVVDDSELNAVILYLPLIYFSVCDDIGGVEIILSAAILYGATLFIKTKWQPQFSKLPIGISVLVYLVLTSIEYSESQVLLLGLLVVVMIVLFVIYSIHNNKGRGSSIRYFIMDLIVVGLWGVLVNLLNIPSDGPLVVWGLGVLLYEGVFLTNMIREKIDVKVIAQRDARLVWFLAGTFALTIEYIADNLSYIWVFILLALFIPVYIRLKSTFLAFIVRITMLLFLTDQFDSILNEEGAFIWEDVFLYGFSLFLTMVSTIDFHSPVVIPWWKGLINARHVVMIRNVFRLIIFNAKRIAFIGGVLTLLVGVFKWMRYAGSGNGEGVRSRDIILLAVYVYAVITSMLIGRVLMGYEYLGSAPAGMLDVLNFGVDDASYVIAWCVWGMVFYIQGILRDYCFARFYATVFVLMPLLTYAINNNFENELFSLMVFICGLVFLSFGVIRQFRGGIQLK